MWPAPGAIAFARRKCPLSEKDSSTWRCQHADTERDRPAAAPRTTRGRSAGREPDLLDQQVTVRWNGRAAVAPVVALRVTTVTVLASVPSTAVAVAATELSFTFAPRAHFEMSSEKTTL